MHKSLLIVLGMAAIAISITGCSDDAARAEKWDRNAEPAVANAHAFTPNPVHPHDSRKETHPESSLSTYNDPDQGVSLRYPKNYLLEEGDVQEHSYFLKTQEQLDSEQPGAELVVTVLVPEDAYPNTTFEHGSVQLWVSEVESSAACRAYADSSQQSGRSKIWTSSGLRFDVAEEDGSVGGTSLRQRHYAGFSGGECYEFLVTIAAEQSTDTEGFVKPADMGKILGRLEKIVTTVKLSPRP